MSISYNSQLKDPRWKDKREEILCRDRYKCRICGCRNNLHVHHKIYAKDRAPWEYTNQFLITLCAGCHKKEHEKKEIKDFVVTNKKILKQSNPNKNNNKRDKQKNKYKSSRSNTSWFDWI